MHTLLCTNNELVLTVDFQPLSITKDIYTYIWNAETVPSVDVSM